MQKLEPWGCFWPINMSIQAFLTTTISRRRTTLTVMGWCVSALFGIFSINFFCMLFWANLLILFALNKGRKKTLNFFEFFCSKVCIEEIIVPIFAPALRNKSTNIETLKWSRKWTEALKRGGSKCDVLWTYWDDKSVRFVKN